MLIDTRAVRIQLLKSEHLKLHDACGVRLTSISGTAWITIDRDAGDVVLVAGDSFVVPSDKSVLVGPLFGTATLDLHGMRPVVTGATARRRGPIAQIKALVGLVRQLAHARGARGSR